MSFTSLVLWLSALPFAGIGAAFLIWPVGMTSLIGLAPADPTALADIRAVYGGLQLGCAGFLVTCARDASLYRPGLALQLASYGGLSLARCVSYAVSGLPTTLGYALHAGETAGLVFGLVAWFRLAKARAAAVS